MPSFAETDPVGFYRSARQYVTVRFTAVDRNVPDNATVVVEFQVNGNKEN